MGPPPAEQPQLTVSDLLDPSTKEWDVEKVQLILPFEEPRVRTIKPSKMGAPDKLMWLLTHTGEYSVKTGYAAALMQYQVAEAVQNAETITN